MAAPAVHQFIPLLSERDATGAHTLLLQAALRRAGWRSEIFTQVTHPDTAHLTIQMEEYPAMASGSDVLVYQFAVASPIADFLLSRDEPVVVDYHNVTPPRFFQGWDQGTVSQLVLAREQFSRLAPHAVLGLADSEFNRRDLVAAGCPTTAVLPVLVELDRWRAEVDPHAAERLAAEKSPDVAEWLFVGRIVPSKAQHHLVMALWAYHRLWGPTARLRLVGSSGCDGYDEALHAFIAQTGLAQWVDLAGGAPDAVMGAYFQNADVYVSLSEHEGFGVPLLEAMTAGLPVVALSAGAVPETVQDAGLVLRHGDPVAVAAALRRVTADSALRAELVARGHARIARFSLPAHLESAVSAIASVAGWPAGAAGARGAAARPATPAAAAEPSDGAGDGASGGAGAGGEDGNDETGSDLLQGVLDDLEATAQALRAQHQLDPMVEHSLRRAFQRIAPVAARQHDPTADALRDVDAHSVIDVHVPVASARAGGRLLKQAMRSASGWYMGYVAQQVTELAAAVSRALHRLADEIDQVRTTLEDLQPATDLVAEVAAIHRADAWWVAPLLAALPPGSGRVLHLACGNGWLVGRLRDRGLDAYGTDPRPAPIATGELHGLDLRCEPTLDHLQSIASGSLGAVVLTGVTECLAAPDRQRLLARVLEGLTSGGVLAVHSISPAGWRLPDAPTAADLAPGRPLRPASWRYLLEAAGCAVTVHEPPSEQEAAGAKDYLVVATRSL